MGPKDETRSESSMSTSPKSALENKRAARHTEEVLHPVPYITARSTRLCGPFYFAGGVLPGSVYRTLK